MIIDEKNLNSLKNVVLKLFGEQDSSSVLE